MQIFTALVIVDNANRYLTPDNSWSKDLRAAKLFILHPFSLVEEYRNKGYVCCVKQVSISID